MADSSHFTQALAAYCRKPSQYRVVVLGSGNINDTYLIQGQNSFVLQRLNATVFVHPLRVIENFLKINDFLADRPTPSDPLLQLASPVTALDGRVYYRDGSGHFWRAQTYIPHRSCRTLKDPAAVRQVGVTLGLFHHQLQNLDTAELADPLPGFHLLSGYLGEFDAALAQMNPDIDEPLRFCLQCVDRFRLRALRLEEAKRAGILRLQPVHGDPKLDNFLFTKECKAFGLLDLDTVGPGLVHCDLGDCLRSSCNLAGEAGGDGREVVFNLQLCRALLDGYFSVQGGMGANQRGYIFDGILTLCFELGLRFLTDYLQGNRYFKIQHQDDNLRRAARQFRLTADVAAKEQQIRVLVERAAVPE